MGSDIPASAGLVFQALLARRALTRAELAARTGLGRSTIGLRLDELERAGLIRPDRTAESTGGRPALTFAVATDARLVVGADLGAEHQTVGIADLSGALLASVTRRGPIARGPEATLRETVDAIDELLEGIGRRRTDVLAIGMGLPGPVEHDSGRPRRPPIMPGWDGADVPGLLLALGGIRALVDNDVNLMAIGERDAARAEVDDLVFVKVSTGIGAGLVSGGRLQRGALGAAGDLGHVAVPDGPPVECACGNTGCLEAIASAPALARRLGIDRAELLARLAAQDAQTLSAVRDAGRSIGAVLATVVSLVNPSIVVVGGRLADAGDSLLAGIREVVYRRATPLATEHLQIVGSATRADAGVRGAVRLALDEALSPASVDALIAAAG